MLEAEQLMVKAAPAAADRREFYRVFGEIVSLFRTDNAAWRLTELTDLATLPDYQDYHSFYDRSTPGAPATPDGDPVFHSMPASWDAAETDGQRWRWVLGRLAAVDDTGRADADMLFARFLVGQFGVHTMGQPTITRASENDVQGAFSVRTLKDNETIARLATGIKRFTLPDEFNFIAILARLSADQDNPQFAAATALLAGCYENRQQYDKAVTVWRRLLAARPDSKAAQTALANITGNVGMLEAIPAAPAGERTRLPFLFRNGKVVTLTAQRLDEKALLADIRQALRQDRLNEMPFNGRPDWIGRHVVERDESKYILETTAEWRVELDPLPGHYSRRQHLEMPFTSAGAYLVTATMDGGNTSRVVMWLSDLAFVRKPVQGGQVVFVADAVTGKPAADVTVTFTGYRWDYDETQSRNQRRLAEFAEKTDENGLVRVDASRVDRHYWLITATAPDGRLAYSGFDSIWPYNYDAGNPSDINAFTITDRPVYRPDQTVHFKVWLGRGTYEVKQDQMLANRPIAVEVRDPRGELIYEKTLTTDTYGGAAAELRLDATAPLGQYMIQTSQDGGYCWFRLEEYKKPEFEVTVDAPDEALALGDTATIRVGAKYYYGSPVTNATVKYKILRTPHRQVWYPSWRWDWLYGGSSWWTSYDYDWYPGWRDWGTARPAQSWMPPLPYAQPEVVMEGEGSLDDEGALRLTLDTAPAKELYGNTDHNYEITVEVTDRSRRTIVGSGRVVAARKPFAVTVWSDRGYYTDGQTARITFRAATALGAGVKAEGEATLYRIHYKDGQPTETEAAIWPIATDAKGEAELKFPFDHPNGQYRIACRLKDASGREVEGGMLLVKRGAGTDGEFRFSSLELVPDKNEYRPGDTLRLAVNADRKDAVVLLFPRAERAEGKPVVVRLTNGTAIVPLEILPSDRPNFYCHAIAIYDGKVFSETREIFVPPADKTLDVVVSSAETSYLPGSRAVFTVTVKDADGTPVQGQCVVSLYDRSVEYISGGSNVGPIQAHFWQWKRHYGSSYANSLRHGYRVEKPGDVRWAPIGSYGRQEADWNDDMVYLNGAMPRSRMLARSQGEMEPPMPAPAAAAPMGDMAEMKQSALAKPMQAEYAAEADTAVATGGDLGGGEGGGMAEPVVRSDFADTALWLATLETDENGKAEFSLDMPQNLTSWKTKVWVMAPGTRVGEADMLVETRKNVIIRPQAPRFLTQKDEVILSANLHNYLPRGKAATAVLKLEGGLLEPAEGVELTQKVTLPANGEARVDWLVKALRPGDATVTMSLLTDEESDAASLTVPVVVHGARRVEPFAGVLREDRNQVVFNVNVPAERLPDQSRLEVSFSPTLASAMLEALPYLIEYPYGCTEQTLNRFLPLVMTRKYLDTLGLTLADAQKAARPARAGEKDPVFDQAEFDAMVRTGLERLGSMQNGDGGWGWFSGSGEYSWPHTTAVVMHGLLTVRDNGVAVPPQVIDSGLDWLRAHRAAEAEKLARYKEDREAGKEPGEDKEPVKAKADNVDAFIHFILSTRGYHHPDMRDFLYRDRQDLSLSANAMLALALHEEGEKTGLDMLLRNLGQYLDRNPDNDTAWLRLPSRGWWWWYNDEIETQAWYLKLLTRVDPKGETTAGVAKYLLQNRKNGNYWRSTRDTAYAIEALAEFAKASGESDPDMTVTVYLDGKPVLERRLTAANLLDDNRLVLEGLAVETGAHEIRVVRSGTGVAYVSGSLDLFSLEDPIAKAGGDLKLQRVFYKLVKRDDARQSRPGATGGAVSARVEQYDRVRLPSPFDAATDVKPWVESGDLVEVELTLTAANDYEYLIIEDLKAAGLEAVELQSGYAGNGMGAYVEYRDQKVALFIRYLPRGVHSMSYRFRAETPGAFSALPAFGGGMYATDLRANSDEMKLRVTETGVFE